MRNKAEKINEKVCLATRESPRGGGKTRSDGWGRGSVKPVP